MKAYLLAMTCLLGFFLGCARDKGHFAGSQSPLEQAPTVEVADAKLVQHSPPQQPTLRVLSYNVHLLPSIAVPFAGTRSDADYRAEQIGQQLAAYDLIGLCETFNASQTKKLVASIPANAAREFHIATGPERSGTHLVGSGLLLLSRYPILETHTTTYENASRLLTNGLKSDGFAAKGALHAKILLDQQSGATLDCFLTHLESQSSDARRLQVREFATFIAEHYQAGNPAIFLGDFNIAGENVENADDSSEYADLRAQFVGAKVSNLIDCGQLLWRGPQGTSDAVATDGGRRIDYIFSANSVVPGGYGVYPRQTEHQRFLDDRVAEGSLSDHLAVDCEFLIIPTRAAASLHRLPKR